jgi:predicted metal-dependent hydrolase
LSQVLGGRSAGSEEDDLGRDPRFAKAVERFNAADWYACHDGFEELWHETQGPMRPVLQGILQIAVAQLHLERGNRRGATVLMGEGLGRLAGCDDDAAGLSLESLRRSATAWLQALQSGDDPIHLAPPTLQPCAGEGDPGSGSPGISSPLTGNQGQGSHGDSK